MDRKAKRDHRMTVAVPITEMVKTTDRGMGVAVHRIGPA
jgi:hypothetical protein